MALTEADAFGRALREVRIEKELSQEAAAEACRVDRAYFGNLERANKSPTLTTVWRVANGLKMRPSELLARAERILDEAR